MSARQGEKAALMTLDKVSAGAYYNIALEETLFTMGLSGGDRSAAVAFSRLALENLIAVDFALSSVTDLKRCKRTVKNILRLGAARMLFSQTPAQVAASSAVELCKSAGKGAQAGYVNAVMRALASKKEGIPWPQGNGAYALSVRYSYPEWACEEAIALLGESAETFLSFRDEGKVSLRANPQRMTREELMEELLSMGIEALPSRFDGRGVIVHGLEAPASTLLYNKGCMSLQGEASMIACKTAEIAEGLVIDVCAAPGGKALNLAETLGARGKVLACDVHPHRVELIEAQKKRLGLYNAKCMLHDAREMLHGYENAAECVLVDAPCTGLGTVLHRPDIKSTRTAEDCRALSQVQKEIISAASLSVKPGGKLVYCTCTYTRAENEEVISDFLDNNREFSLKPIDETECLKGRGESGMLRLWPHIDGTDAFFIAKMERRI